jgi:hypothetical protein
MLRSKLKSFKKSPTSGSVQYLHLSGHSTATIPAMPIAALATMTKLHHNIRKSPQCAWIFVRPIPRAMFSVRHGLPPAHGIALHSSVRPYCLTICNASCKPANVRRSSSMVSRTTLQPLLYFDARPSRPSCPQHHSMITRS